MGREKDSLSVDAAAAAQMGISYGKYKAIQYDRWREANAQEEAARAKRRAERDAAREREYQRRRKAAQEDMD